MHFRRPLFWQRFRTGSPSCFLINSLLAYPTCVSLEQSGNQIVTESLPGVRDILYLLLQFRSIHLVLQLRRVAQSMPTEWQASLNSVTAPRMPLQRLFSGRWSVLVLRIHSWIRQSGGSVLQAASSTECSYPQAVSSVLNSRTAFQHVFSVSCKVYCSRFYVKGRVRSW